MNAASLAPRPGRALAPAAEQTVGVMIEGGLHEGARLSLDAGSYRIGSAADCDIILHDDGVATRHALLRVVEGEIHLEAVGGSVALDPERRRVLPAGSGVKPALPATIWIGQARLRLTGRAAARSGMRGTAIAASGLLAVAGALVVHAMTSPPAAMPMVAAQSGGSSALVAPASGGQVSEAAAQLRRRLASSGLTGVAVTASGERVLATGTIEPAQQQAWSAAQQAFDAAHGGRLQLGSEVRVAQREDGPKVSLQAVWLGEQPYVLTADGGRHHQGAFLDNGWTIRSITKEGITFVQGERHVTLTF